MAGFSYTNKTGQRYFLHSKTVHLKNGRKQQIYFFAREEREGSLETVPTGYTVMETSRTGMPVLKKNDDKSISTDKLSLLSFEFDGFLFNLFEDMEYAVEYHGFRQDHDFDLIASNDEEIIVIEAKSYRSVFINNALINSALEQLQNRSDKLEHYPECMKLRVCLAVLCVANDNQRYTAKEKGIEILDIRNMLYITQANPELAGQLSLIAPFPIQDIAPLEPEREEINQSLRELHGNKIEKNGKQLGKYEEMLLTKLQSLPPGTKKASTYEKLCKKIVHYLFQEEFIKEKSQHSTEDGMFRMDLICSLKGEAAFWKLLINHYNSRFVVFDFKNYEDELGQNIIYVTEKYLFNSALRNVAIIISRKGLDKNAKKAVSGCLKENGKLIISLNDKDLFEMISMKKRGDDPSDYLLDEVEKFLMLISK